jgi:hypothetical protein
MQVKGEEPWFVLNYKLGGDGACSAWSGVEGEGRVLVKNGRIRKEKKGSVAF